MTYKISLILELITLILHQKNKLKRNDLLHQPPYKTYVYTCIHLFLLVKQRQFNSFKVLLIVLKKNNF